MSFHPLLHISVADLLQPLHIYTGVRIVDNSPVVPIGRMLQGDSVGKQVGARDRALSP